MRILHLPINIASQIQITVRALRSAGFEARGMLASPSAIHSGDGMESIFYGHHRQWSPAWFRTVGAAFARTVEGIVWADVLHYHFGGSRAMPRDLDIRLSKALNRLRLITFWGTDIRVAKIEFDDNPYYQRIYPTVPKWATLATHEHSRRVQEAYAQSGFHCVLGNESMFAHVDRSLFPEIHLIRCAIDPRDFVPSYPDPDKKRPLVVHSPSDPLVKGTKFVEEAVEKLRAKGLNFDFQMLTGVPRSELMEIISRSDIFLDQFIVGGYGMVALEAMAMGKPVMCFIKPSMVEAYPHDLPIVNATVDNLEEKLEQLIVDGEERLRIARLGPDFVRKYHDSHDQAIQLTELYKRLMQA